ncbi:DUF5753 domain-containing protein [Streptomyces sp. NPDC018031]|uniref:DUF5753 domain-containing protein n=1 Tax=Streptomyces sp. NPDC018031 TaxID=3365033 RepID=UPI0037BCA8DA
MTGDNGVAEGPRHRGLATDGANGPGWDTGVEEGRSGTAVRTVGSLAVRLEETRSRQPERGPAIGYREAAPAAERGRRKSAPSFLTLTDEPPVSGGQLAVLEKDVMAAGQPGRTRRPGRLEDDAVELGAYNNSVVDALLQTEEYARAVLGGRRPAFTEAELERRVAARMARQDILLRSETRTGFTFVQCEATLRRTVGGRAVMRRQLEHLLEVGQWRNVDLRVLPLSCAENAGLGGSLRVLRLRDGSTVGHNEVQMGSPLFTDPKEVRVLDIRFEAIRGQALLRWESLAFIEKVLGEL